MSETNKAVDVEAILASETSEQKLCLCGAPSLLSFVEPPSEQHDTNSHSVVVLRIQDAVEHQKKIRESEDTTHFWDFCAVHWAAWVGQCEKCWSMPVYEKMWEANGGETK